jgi:hypothetical protein
MKTSYEFKNICLVFLMSMLLFSLSGCSKSCVRNQSQISGYPGYSGYPIASDVQTTLQRTIVQSPTPTTAINLWEISKYSQYGYGNWTYGPGLPYDKRLDIMPAAYSGSSVAKKTKLLNFFTISDIHITDKESPNQLIYLQRLHPKLPVGGSLYSGIMMYTTHVLDAAVQTVNALHNKDNKANPFDFGFSLGDTCNSTQYNELRWYIDVLDGKVITPSSGAHLGAGTIDYQKPYKAAGLDKTIPDRKSVV